MSTNSVAPTKSAMALNLAKSICLEYADAPATINLGTTLIV